MAYQEGFGGALSFGLGSKRSGLYCRAEGCRAVFGRSGDQASLTVLLSAATDRDDHELRAHGLRPAQASAQPPIGSERRDGIPKEPSTAAAPEVPLASPDEDANVIRDRIMALLGRQGPASFENLLAELDAPERVVHSQLKVLVASRLVRIEAERSRSGRGRPRHRYALTDTTAGIIRRRYDALAEELLLEVKAIGGQELIEQIFRQRCNHLEVRYRPRFAGTPLRERVQEIARLLEEKGESVSWRQVDDRTFLISKPDCSIFNLGGHAGSACRSELTLLSRLLEATVRREEHLADGGAGCSYVITEAKRRRAMRRPGSADAPTAQLRANSPHDVS